MTKFKDLTIGQIFTRWAPGGPRYRRMTDGVMMLDGKTYQYNAIAVDYAGRPRHNGQALFPDDFEVTPVEK